MLRTAEAPPAAARTTDAAAAWPAPAFVALCIVLGGASAAGHVANLLVQLAALAAIAWTLAGRSDVPGPLPTPLLIGVAAILALVVAQLVPLPIAWWSALPQRDEIARSLELAGATPAALPLSLAPQATVAAALALLPALAAALLMTAAPSSARLVLGTIALLALLSVVLGVGQVTGGRGGPLYLYSITNGGSAVGFFANRNHLASLALVALPCLALLATHANGRAVADAGFRGRQLAAGAAAVTLVFGIVISGSDAGLLLVGPALLASLLIVRDERLGWPHLLGFGALVVALVVAAVVWAPDLGAALSLGASEPLDRRYFWAGTTEAIALAFPAGTGLGSFAQVYRTIEDPATVTPIFVNHAHNDYLEIALEAGLAGVLLVAAFLAWWSVRAVRIWRTSARTPKAATVVTGLLLVHGAVDYPLRTAALMAVFAAACAIMARPAAVTK